MKCIIYCTFLTLILLVLYFQRVIFQVHPSNELNLHKLIEMHYRNLIWPVLIVSYLPRYIRKDRWEQQPNKKVQKQKMPFRKQLERSLWTILRNGIFPILQMKFHSCISFGRLYPWWEIEFCELFVKWGELIRWEQAYCWEFMLRNEYGWQYWCQRSWGWFRGNHWWVECMIHGICPSTWPMRCWERIYKWCWGACKYDV